jgi:N-acetylglucosamine kinase-like BadF-type ATPase
MRYVLGIDGGGSKTACLAADETGKLLGYGLGGPVNTNYVPHEVAVGSMTSAINAALEGAKLPGDQIEMVCLSAPIAPDALDEATRICQLEHVTRAAEGATPRWAARFWTDEHIGVTVDAGTGSLARGWTIDGREAGSGAWGATLGDEGSGFWISMQAMIAILQAHDGRTKPTMLTQAVLQHLGISDVLDMVFLASQGMVRSTKADHVGVVPDSDSAYSEEDNSPSGGVFFRKRLRNEAMTRDEVAALCPVVVNVAQSGDWKAIAILEAAGRELGRLGVAVIDRLGLEEDKFAVVPFGGVFKAGELILHSFRETIHATAPEAVIIQPKFQPVVGAVLLALKAIGVEMDEEIIANIERRSVDYPACRVV